MKQPKQITREQANEIIKDQAHKPSAKVTIAYRGKWYDIRGVSEDELETFITGLMGRKITEAETGNINITL